MRSTGAAERRRLEGAAVPRGHARRHHGAHARRRGRPCSTCRRRCPSRAAYSSGWTVARLHRPPMADPVVDGEHRQHRLLHEGQGAAGGPNRARHRALPRRRHVWSAARDSDKEPILSATRGRAARGKELPGTRGTRIARPGEPKGVELIKGCERLLPGEQASKPNDLNAKKLPASNHGGRELFIFDRTGGLAFDGTGAYRPAENNQSKGTPLRRRPHHPSGPALIRNFPIQQRDGRLMNGHL